MQKKKDAFKNCVLKNSLHQVKNSAYSTPASKQGCKEYNKKSWSYHQKASV